MLNNGDYPLGAAHDPRAPYNEKENPEVEVTVCVSVTYHKTFKLKVRDYEILDEYVDEDGQYACTRDFSDCDLYDAFERQVGPPKIDHSWTEDEFEVILDE